MLYWHPVQLNLSALCFSLRLASLTSFSSAVSWALACLFRSLLIRSLSCLRSLSGFILCNFFLCLQLCKIHDKYTKLVRTACVKTGYQAARTMTYIHTYIHTEKLSTEVTKIGLATLAPMTVYIAGSFMLLVTIPLHPPTHLHAHTHTHTHTHTPTQFGYDDLTPYGHPTSNTPHIQLLAEQGLVFTQFYTTSPVCCPSRAAD